MAKFKKGQTGNPNGRPRGAKSAIKMLASDLISEEDVQAVLQAVIDAAKGGDLMAAGMVLDRCVPRVRPIVADPEREAEVVAALAAARLRSGGGGLEALVAGAISYTVVTGVEAPQVEAEPPSLPRTAAPATSPPAAPLAAPRKVSISLPPLPADTGTVIRDYDPLA